MRNKPLPEKTVLMGREPTPLSLEKAKYSIFTMLFLYNALHYMLVSYPQGLESALTAVPYEFSGFEYGVFYGITAFPNIILPLFVGMYIDREGLSSFLHLVLSLSIFLGCILITVGASSATWWLMCLGRLFLGLGAENIAVMIKRILLQIAPKQESVAIWGVFLVSSRIGSLLASWFPPFFYELTESVTQCFFVATLFGFLMIIFSAFALILVKKTQIPLVPGSEDQIETSSFGVLKNFAKETHWIFWLITILDCANFFMFYGFFSSANSFLTKVANLDSIDASYFLIVFSTFCGLFQPFFGIIFSKYGYHIFAIFIGVTLNIIAFSLFLFMFGTSDALIVLIPTLLLGLGYSSCSTFVFSTSGLIVTHNNHGLAYGILQNCINFGFLIGPLVYGVIKDATMAYDEGFFWATIECLIAEIVVGILGIGVWAVDHHYVKVLSIKNVHVSE